MEQLENEKMDIDLSDEFKEVERSINSLKKSIDQLRSFTNDPKNMVYEYFLKLRNKIDLDREKIKDKIDIHYLGLIDELKLVEDDHMNNELENQNKIFSAIEKAEIKLAKYNNKMDVLKIDTEKLKNIVLLSDQQNLKINCKITDLENEFFSNKRFTYANNESDVENLRFNLNKVKITSFTVNGSFNVVLKDLKNFTEEEYTDFDSENYNFNGMNWAMNINMLEADHLSCFVSCDLGFKRPKLKDLDSYNDIEYEITTEEKRKIEDGITTEVRAYIRITCHNNKCPEKNEILEYEYNHTNDDNYGDEHLQIYTEDIFCENGFHNTEEDSIHFSVSIQILDICE